MNLLSESCKKSQFVTVEKTCVVTVESSQHKIFDLSLMLNLNVLLLFIQERNIILK